MKTGIKTGIKTGVTKTTIGQETGMKTGIKTGVISMIALAVFSGPGPVRAAGGEGAAELAWDPATGVQVRTPKVLVRWDQNDQLAAPVLKFAKGETLPLKNPHVTRLAAHHLRLAYEVATPDGVALKVTRELTLSRRAGECELVEAFELSPAKPITIDLEIQRPFTIADVKASAAASAVCPLYNGWARPSSLSGAPLAVEYRMGNFDCGYKPEAGGFCYDGPVIPCSHPAMTPHVSRLSLPVVQLDGAGAWRAALMSDCRFSSLFSMTATNNGTVQGVVRYTYAGVKVPLAGIERRHFGLWLAPPPAPDEPFGKSLDAFYRLMLPEVPPGPKWIHDVAMTYYDYFEREGKGWEEDIHALAQMIKPEERSKVVVCFHGWYESIGGYNYDDATGKMKSEWKVFKKHPLTLQEMKRRLRLAKDLGFRVILYFADGLHQDPGAPFPECQRPEWLLKGENGQPVGGWVGPDCWQQTLVRNPTHPEVVRFYTRYMAALLENFKDEIDGLVWDETHPITMGMIQREPAPAYCDRAMLDLVGSLRRQVHAVSPEKVFMIADATGMIGSMSYAMVADGQFQDTECRPDTWSYQFFPCWRNVNWNCCWGSMGGLLPWIQWSAERLGAPVAISAYWGGPSVFDKNPQYRDEILRLFRQHSAMKRVRYFSEDPVKMQADSPHPPVLPSDTIPLPAAGEFNWTRAGATATASSVYDKDGAQCGPMGLIDGGRGFDNWLKGHGWASKQDQKLPQWVEISFPQPRTISRFHVFNYAPGFSIHYGGYAVSQYGVRQYDIEAWDESARAWKRVVEERLGRVMSIRVHQLAQPVTTSKFRLTVHAAGPDGLARLLQVEAWGPASPASQAGR